MLAKLMKYEIKASGRILLPMFGLSMGVSLLLRLVLAIVPHIWEPLGNILLNLASTIGGLLPLLVFVLAFVFVVARFYQSLATDEAYLSFTLPVTVNAHLAARLVVALLYSLAAIVVAALDALIFIPGVAGALRQVFSSLTLPASFYWQAGLLLAGFVLVALINSLLHLYAAIAIGTQFGRHRVIGGVVGYLVLNIVASIFSMVLFALPSFGVLKSNSEFEQMILSLVNSNSTVAVAQGILSVVSLAFAAVALVMLVISAIYYGITLYLFSKKLNL